MAATASSTNALTTPSVELPLMTQQEQLRSARDVLRHEAIALWRASLRLGDEFNEAIELLSHCQGAVIVTGMGKAGLIGQKITATLASTGTTSHFLHPAEAFHGDLGRVKPGDVVLVLSQSGETGEVVQLLPSLAEMETPIIAITARNTSTLGQAAEVVLPLGEMHEACSMGLAPSTSTTAMLAMGDALAIVLSASKGFQAEDFAKYHPGGSLGRKLARVNDMMRPLSECRVASQTETVRNVIVGCGKPGRRTGAVMLTDESGKLTGLFTDSDLAKLFEHHSESALDCPISEVMIQAPTTIHAGARMSEAVNLLANRKFSELPVVDDAGCPLGLVDVTDVVSMKQSSADSTKAEANGNSKPIVKLYTDDVTDSLAG